MADSNVLLDESRLGFRPRELARAIGCSEQTVRDWIASGILPAERFGRSLIITCETLRQKNLLPPGWPGGRL
jgi:excisionase family DNA binding protein